MWLSSLWNHEGCQFDELGEGREFEENRSKRENTVFPHLSIYRPCQARTAVLGSVAECVVISLKRAWFEGKSDEPDGGANRPL